MKKEKQIHLYLSDSDYVIIKQAARARGMNANEFIRYCCAHVIDNTYVRNYKED